MKITTEELNRWKDWLADFGLELSFYTTMEGHYPKALRLQRYPTSTRVIQGVKY